MTWLAVAGVITALGGLIATIYKLRPESTKIFVDSAAVSVKLADAGRDDLADRLAEEKAERAQERAEHNKYRTDTGAHMAEQATLIRGLRAELQHCERERLRQQDGGAP